MAMTCQPWPQVIYSNLGLQVNNQILDAIRTATLIVGSGIRPAARGSGGAVRRLMRPLSIPLGLSRVVRWAHGYWSSFRPLTVPWNEVCRVLDLETSRQ